MREGDGPSRLINPGFGVISARWFGDYPPGYDAGKNGNEDVAPRSRARSGTFPSIRRPVDYAIVHAADIQDRDGGPFVMATMFGMYPFLMKLYADGGYQGPLFRRAVAKIMARLNVEIVKPSDHANGFVLLPKRWVVERTFAWLGRCRRLAKDWENLNRKALAFLRLASIRLMLRKLCNPV